MGVRERFLLCLSLLFIASKAFVTLPFGNSQKKFFDGGKVGIISSKLKASNLLYGGDFAGLSADFSPDGNLIRVPDHLVPKEMLEWEDSPACLEVLVSEEGEESSTSWLRQTISVLPAVGCGVDNLETNKKEEVMEVQSLSSTDDIVSFDVEYKGDDKKGRRTETIFAVEINEKHRLRVILDILWDSETGFAFKKPINLIMERKVNITSSGGTIADGGGLTGSQVTELLGPQLKVSSPFCEESPLDWKPQGVKILNLPGNVTIACSEDPMQSPWMLDIVHVNINEKGEAEQQVVRRSYYAEDIAKDIE